MPAKSLFACVTLAAFGAFTVPVVAYKPVDQPPAVKAPPAKKATLLKTYDFKFSNAKWAEVLDWFKDTTGLTFIGPNVPTGTFSFDPPIDKTTGKPLQFTIKQIVTVLNEQLAAQKWMLIRHEYSFLIHPIDVPTPESPRLVTLDKLEEGDLDDGVFVRVTYQLQSLKAESFAPLVEKMMMNPFGRVIPLEEPNQLILMEQVKNLQIIIQKDPRTRQSQVEVRNGSLPRRGFLTLGGLSPCSASFCTRPSPSPHWPSPPSPGR